MPHKNAAKLLDRSKVKKPSTIKTAEDEENARAHSDNFDITGIVQLAKKDPSKLGSQNLLELQRTIGNEAVSRIVGQSGDALQKQDTTTTEISETTDTGNKYTQELVLNRKKARISIHLGVNWQKKGTWASEKAYQRFIQRMKTAVYSYLDNKFKVVCTPKAKGAGKGPIELPIDFLLYDYAKGYKIEVHGGKPGSSSSMSQSGGNFYEYYADGDPIYDATFAHEFGHAILGASDEYANPKLPGRVLTNDHSIMANYYSQGRDKAEFKARHFQHIVKEVAKAFAGYTCNIKPM